MNMLEKCDVCNGRGRLWDDERSGWVRCGGCSGAGERLPLELLLAIDDAIDDGVGPWEAT